MKYIRNAWNMIAWADEIGEKPFTRTILDMAILLYREPEEGKVIAMMDRCPHRFAPLSMGQIVGSHVQCGYHGLEFNSSGQCVLNPFSGAVPSAAKVRTFPVVEQDRIIWIWTGEPAAADPDRIVRFPHHTDPNQRCIFGYTTANANYQLLTDNLMDLTHVCFLHPGFGGLAFKPRVTSSEDSDGSVVANFIVDKMPNWLDRSELDAEYVHLLDRMIWHAPAVHLLEGIATSPDNPDLKWESPAAHILTPQNELATHYFWSSAVHKDSPLTDEDHMTRMVQAFDVEDKPMVEAVQRSMGTVDLWELEPVLLKTDSAPVRVRRRIEAILAAEAQQEPKVVAPGSGERINA